MAAALTHMLGATPDPGLDPGPVLAPAPAVTGILTRSQPGSANGHSRTAGHGEAAPGPARRPRPDDDARSAGGPVRYEDVEAYYAADLAAGNVPTGKDIRRTWHVGSEKAGQFRAGLLEAAARAAG